MGALSIKASACLSFGTNGTRPWPRSRPSPLSSLLQWWLLAQLRWWKVGGVRQNTDLGRRRERKPLRTFPDHAYGVGRDPINLKGAARRLLSCAYRIQVGHGTMPEKGRKQTSSADDARALWMRSRRSLWRYFQSDAQPASRYRGRRSQTRRQARRLSGPRRQRGHRFQLRCSRC